MDFDANTGTLLAATYGRSMFSITIDDMVSAQDANANNIEATLFPSPTRTASSIKMEVPKLADYTISIFDISGVQVRSIFQGTLAPGEHKIDFNVNNLAAGNYIVQASADDGSLANLRLVKIE